LCPHFAQNRTPILLAFPHAGQAAVATAGGADSMFMFAPQRAQNFASGRFSA
jgi:hypothetical protein